LRSTILKQFFRLRSVPFVQNDKGRAEKKQFIDPKRITFQPLKTTHQRYADVFEKLGYPITLLDMDILSKKSLSEPLLQLCKGNNRVLIGIAPFAAFEGKMYPSHLMEKVVQELNDTNKYKIILFGGGIKEAAILSNWESQYGNVINAAGKFPFSEELSLVSNLELMLAMDSGNAHLAAMYGVPTLTLWGVTHPFAGFYPFGQPESNALLADRNRYPLIPTSIYGNKFPAGYGNVMETIKPNEVVEKIVEILKVSS
jgi:ADP-heptose:LPS heptosyltransferase